MRDVIRFLLGERPVELRGVDPQATVLEWLRRDALRTGTKEGCAEGDCGACTVALGRPRGDGMRYEAINACIRFLPTIDGCQLLTVEDLKGADGTLHPVQQALVEHHGSQCGFCTPGIVMSLFVAWRNGAMLTPDAVDDVLAGNLCRCTGYGPIAAAGRALGTIADRSDRWLDCADTVEALRGLDDGETLEIAGAGTRFLAPRTEDELAALLVESPDATVLAGATDVGLWVTKQHRRLATVVWLGRVEELRRIDETDGTIELGAGVTYAEAAPALARAWPDAGELIRRTGSTQIRACGTIGGNVANGSPIGDMPPLLIAAGTTLVLRRGNERRELPLEAFFLGYGRQDRRPGEYVSRLRIPKRSPSTWFFAYKISKRFDQDISAVCAAIRIDLDGDLVHEARLAFGGMAAVPKRATAAETALVGRSWRRETIEAAMTALGDDFAPLSDMRASAGYRLRVARNLLLKAFLEHEGGTIRVLEPREPALA